MAKTTTAPRVRTIPFRWGILLLLLTVLQHFSSASNPTHRYSFTSNADDSNGGAHGTVLGNAIITNGNLVLNGTNGCVQLPGDLLTNSKSLTMEIWFANNQHLAPRSLWSFSGSPAISFLIRGFGFGSDYRSRGYYGSQSANSMVDAVQISLGKFHHLVWTQDQLSHTATIFLDGLQYAQNTNFTATPGTTTTSYLGGAGLTSPIRGNISEFRIYSNALSHLEVLQRAALGPDMLPFDGGVLTNLDLRVASHLALNSITRPLVFADFTDQQDVNITPLRDIVFASSETNIINPTTNGYLNGVGLGFAEIVVTYGGLSTTTGVAVVTAEQFALAHRYNFDGIAANPAVADLAGGVPGTVIGGGTLTNGSQLFLDGVNDHVDFPDGILSSLSEVTIEAWVTGFSLNGKFWPRVFDFGGGASYFFLAPSVQTDNLGTNTQFMRFAVSTNGIIAESPRLTARPWMLDGFETHLAVTYSPTRNSSKLYLNGMLVDSGPATYPLNFIVDTNNWLGRSAYVGDNYFHGLFNEFRIYRTVLDDSEIAASFALGSDVIGADFALHGRTAGTNLTLSWGPSAAWCALETTPSVTAGAVWTNAATVSVFTNGHFEATIPFAEGNRFFRLSPH